MLILQTMESPVGALRLVANRDALVGLYLPAQDAQVEALEALREGPSRVLDEATRQLRAYFAGERRAFDLPLAPRGTGFQRLVWSALERIPFGETRHYGGLAASLGRPAASRAVGAANGKNPISIVVPCHRVIAASGALAGYAGGLAAKQWLLAHEGAPGATVAACSGRSSRAADSRRSSS